MRTLNPEAKAIMYKIVNKMVNGYLKIDTNPDFMPFIIEEIFENDEYKIYSIGHYSMMNGERMSDPQQNILLFKTTGEFLPISLKQDYVGVNEYSVIFEDQEIVGEKEIQSYHAYFCDIWLESIERQQNLEI